MLQGRRLGVFPLATPGCGTAPLPAVTARLSVRRWVLPGMASFKDQDLTDAEFRECDRAQGAGRECSYCPEARIGGWLAVEQALSRKEHRK
jgi:hypothetical protein